MGRSLIDARVLDLWCAPGLGPVAIHCIRLTLVVKSAGLLTFTGALHVAPWSLELMRKMSFPSE